MADIPQKKYTPMQFPHLKGLKGLSDAVLETHFKLYEGYVNRTNKLTESLSGLQVKGEDDCPFQSNCPVRPKWGHVQVAMMREMASITFEDLAKESAGVPMVLPSLV